MIQNIVGLFTQEGGQFITNPDAVGKTLQKIRGLLFDWDGVFNNGAKSSEQPSTFSEIDSMGINMLRFAIWLQTGEVPFTGIITGQVNDSAFELAKREHFQAVYYNFKWKKEALDHIKSQFGLNSSQMLFVYDDILDISAAKHSGFSVLVRRDSSPMFTEFVKKNKYADYITAFRAEQNAVRETCELVMGLLGKFDQVVNQRIEFSEEYGNFLQQRNQISSSFFHKSDKKIIETII